MFDQYSPQRACAWFDFLVAGWGKWLIWLLLCGGLTYALECNGQWGTYYGVFFIVWTALTAVCQAIFSGRSGRL